MDASVVRDTDQGPEAVFRAFLGEGRFMIQRSSQTGEYVFYPRPFAPGDAAAALEWVAPSGRGTVYATTLARRRPEKGGDYNVSLVELEEGPRLMTRIVGIPAEDVKIGMAVTARVETLGGEPAVVFAPAETAGAAG